MCAALPAFDCLWSSWQDLQTQHPLAYDVIQASLDKLEVYSNCAQVIPAYIVSMGMLYFTHVRIRYMGPLTSPTYSSQSPHEAQSLLATGYGCT